MMDVANLFIFHQGGTTIEPELPRSLERKLAFFRKAHEHLDKFKPDASHAMSLYQSMYDLRTFRHDMIHGMHLNYYLQDEDEPTLRWRYVSDNLFSHQNKYTIAQIDANERIIYTTARSLHGYMLKIGAPRNNHGNDPSTKL